MVLRVFLYLSLVHLYVDECTAMRNIPFKSVLHGVAHKFSLDPEQSNFLTNQAIPIGEYIDQWVRRLYDARDWPEWTVTKKFAPSNHVVTWDALALGAPTVSVKIGRVISVFLVDPSTTDAPIDTPFTLTDTGIHVGYQHGSFVWIKYLAPPPKFTAEQWNAATTYALDDVAYSYTTGEVYRSKANSNFGHDPASNFSLPPNPIIGHPPSLPPPSVEITQQWTPDNPGIVSRSQIVIVDFNQTPDGTAIPDPLPDFPAGVVVAFNVNYGGTLPAIANAAVAGTPLSIADAIDDMVADLIAYAELASFTITGDHANKTITIEDASNFTIEDAIYRAGTEGPNHFLKVSQTQSYQPAFSAASGQPQIAQITINADTTYPGATYELLVTDSSGVDHTVEYVSQLYDSSAQILQGIILAVEVAAATDTFWQGVQLAFDPTGITLDVSVRDRVSVALRPAPTGSGWWELVPFPKAIADAVMRGAVADLNREWGQTEKAAAEEAVVPQETDIAAGDFTTMPDPPLTTQQAGYSRYKVH